MIKVYTIEKKIVPNKKSSLQTIENIFSMCPMYPSNNASIMCQMSISFMCN